MPRIEENLEDARADAKANAGRAGEAERQLAAANASLTAACAELERERLALAGAQTEIRELRAATNQADARVADLAKDVAVLGAKLEAAQAFVEPSP